MILWCCVHTNTTHTRSFEFVLVDVQINTSRENSPVVLQKTRGQEDDRLKGSSYRVELVEETFWHMMIDRSHDAPWCFSPCDFQSSDPSQEFICRLKSHQLLDSDNTTQAAEASTSQVWSVGGDLEEIWRRSGGDLEDIWRRSGTNQEHTDVTICGRGEGSEQCMLGYVFQNNEPGSFLSSDQIQTSREHVGEKCEECVFLQSLRWIIVHTQSVLTRLHAARRSPLAARRSSPVSNDVNKRAQRLRFTSSAARAQTSA